MTVLRQYNSGTSSWEVVVVGASGTNGTNGQFYTAVTTYSASTVTAAIGDLGALVLLSNATSCAVTIPPSYGSTGDTITLVQYGAGQVTVVAGSGVTLRYSTTLKTRSQYAAITAIKLGTNEWLVAGDTAPS
jgi:hypothetical protein